MISPDSRGKHAGDDVDQRRLSGAVVADQRNDLARKHVEINVLEGVHRTEMFVDAASKKNGSSIGAVFSHARVRLRRVAIGFVHVATFSRLLFAHLRSRRVVLASMPCSRQLRYVSELAVLAARSHLT